MSIRRAPTSATSISNSAPWADVGASTRQFDMFRSLAGVGTSVEAAMVRSGVPPHVQAFVAHTMALAQSGRRKRS
jgi:hypothetical protein